jgi:DNA polymerase-3 subunit epsilon
MIVLDIETSGLDPVKCGIWQIGAFELENPKNIFFEEARIDDDEVIESGALAVIGKTEQELRDANKQSQKELLAKFFMWIRGIPVKNCICQNPQFDIGFIESKARKMGFFTREEFPLPHRSFDLHSIASLKYHLINNAFLIENGRSNMNLGNVLKFCGMHDNRKNHNALEDAQLTAECFSRIVYGKNIFNEYAQFEIPEYLQHDNLQ